MFQLWLNYFYELNGLWDILIICHKLFLCIFKTPVSLEVNVSTSFALCFAFVWIVLLTLLRAAN